MDIQAKLQQGIAVAKAGRKSEARQLFIEVIEADENQLTAWLWLKQLVDSLEDKEVCLKNILTLYVGSRYYPFSSGNCWRAA